MLISNHAVTRFAGLLSAPNVQQSLPVYCAVKLRRGGNGVSLGVKRSSNTCRIRYLLQQPLIGVGLLISVIVASLKRSSLVTSAKAHLFRSCCRRLKSRRIRDPVKLLIDMVIPIAWQSLVYRPAEYIDKAQKNDTRSN